MTDFPIPPTYNEIGEITIMLLDGVRTALNAEMTDMEDTPYQTCQYKFNLDFDKRTVTVLQGDLAPYLTSTQMDELTAIMNSVRAKAVADLLP